MSNKTAMQSLIKMLKIELEASEKYHSRSNALEMAIKLAEAQLSVEKQQMIDAYTHKRLTIPTVKTVAELIDNAKQYYNDTYNH
jgi:hypothetical protein